MKSKFNTNNDLTSIYAFSGKKNNIHSGLDNIKDALENQPEISYVDHSIEDREISF